MRVLRVGDPHITVRNIPEAEKLVRFIKELAADKEVDTIEFMGDQFHTHAVLRVEVVDFWRRAFKELELPILALVGNHDQPGSREKEQKMNALQVFKSIPYVKIVDKPFENNGILYMPYMSDHDLLIKLCQESDAKVLVAHQTFTGAQYENGFYAPDGIDPEQFPQSEIISGHIHKCQQVGKCFYVGTPKWDSMSDANEDKGVWIFDHNEDGTVASKEFYSTKEVVTPIYKHVINEGEEEPELFENARNYIELRGKSAWIKEMKKKYKGKAQIKAKPIDRKMPKLDRQTKHNIFDFLDNDFAPIDGVNKNTIKEYLKQTVGL